jgi:hypothetical protein
VSGLIDIDYIDWKQWDSKVYESYWQQDTKRQDLRSFTKSLQTKAPKSLKAYIEVMAVLRILFGLSNSEVIEMIQKSLQLTESTRNLNRLSDVLRSSIGQWTRPPKKPNEVLLLLEGMTPEQYLAVRVVEPEKFLAIRQKSVTYQDIDECSVLTPQENLKELGFINQDGIWHNKTQGEKDNA